MDLLQRVAQRLALLLGFALASKDIVRPYAAEVEQANWAAKPVNLLDPGTVAELVAQRLWDPGEGYDEAIRQGYDRGRLASLIQRAEGPPDRAALEAMHRRGLIDEDDYKYALERLQVEGRWFHGLAELLHERLSPADMANAIQQGFVENPGVLPVTPPTTPGKVATEPPTKIDPLKESAAFGIDKERLKVLARLAGLPPGPETLLEMVRRNIIEPQDLIRGVAQGHTKTEWADAYLAMLHHPLSAPELATLVVKRWITLEQGIERAELVGVRESDFRLLVQGTGRPPAPGQLQQAFNRGLIDRARFEKGIAESDLRTEWTDVHLGLRVHYPSAFALRQLLTSKAITAEEGADILRKEGWPADLATKVAHAWAGAGASKLKELSESQVATLYEARYIDRDQAEGLLAKLGYSGDEVVYLLELADARRVTRFLNTAVGRLHTLFVGHRAGEQAVVQGLNELGISSSAVDDLMATWKLEREANLPSITPAEITTAVRYELITRERGIALLMDRGYTEHDARFKIDVRMHAAPPGEAL